MITQYRITFRTAPGQALYPDSAYRLYAYLLEQLPPEDAALVHDTGTGGIGQFLQYQKDPGPDVSTLNLLQDGIGAILGPVLETMTQLCILGQCFSILSRERRQMTLDSLLSHSITANRATITFCVPTAFKQNGRYTIFPQERLILQSLVMRWNESFPMCALEDPDAFDAMLAGVHIVDYQLRSTRFLLKGVRIPGFVGSCVLEAKLAPPLLQLLNSLLSFADFSGIGIKTGIGMGGVQVKRNP